MNELRIRVEETDDFFRGALAAARRVDAGDVAARSASLSFQTMDTLFRTLTPNRWILIGTLRRMGPVSIRALAKRLERDFRGVHADVAKLLEVGLIERDDHGKIVVPWSKITAELSLDAAA